MTICFFLIKLEEYQIVDNLELDKTLGNGFQIHFDKERIMSFVDKTPKQMEIEKEEKKITTPLPQAELASPIPKKQQTETFSQTQTPIKTTSKPSKDIVDTEDKELDKLLNLDTTEIHFERKKEPSTSNQLQKKVNTDIVKGNEEDLESWLDTVI